MKFRAPRLWPVWGFALALWSLGTLFYGGRIGKWCDDYGNYLRDPVTDTFSLKSLEGSWYSWTLIGRAPAAYLFHALAQNYLWHHDWVIHVLAAVVHGVNGILVFVLVRRVLGEGAWRGAAVAGLVMVSWPAGFEGVFWITGICAAIAPTVSLVLMLLVVRFARGEVGWWFLAPGVVLAWLIPAWYEQPAMMLPALLLLYLAAARTGEPLARRFVRGSVVSAVLSLGLVAYTVGMIVGLPAKTRGGASSYAAVSEIPGRIVEIARQAVPSLTMEESWRGALRQGFVELSAHPVRGLVWVVVLMLGAAGFWRCWMDRESDREARRGESVGANSGRGWWLLGFAGACFVLYFVPAVVIRGQWIVPRLVYVHGVSLGIMAGVLVDALLRRSAGWRGKGVNVRRGLGAIVIGGGVFGALCLLGFQGGYRRRWEMDLAQWRRIKELVPNPSPQTVFVPLELKDWPTATGDRRFDTHFLGIFDFTYTGGLAAHAFYHRRDVAHLGHNRWQRRHAEDFADADATGIRLISPVVMPTYHDGMRVGWDQIVPLVTEEGGRVSIVTHVVIEGEGDPKIIPTQAAGLAGVARREYRLEGGAVGAKGK